MYFKANSCVSAVAVSLQKENGNSVFLPIYFFYGPLSPPSVCRLWLIPFNAKEKCQLLGINEKGRRFININFIEQMLLLMSNVTMASPPLLGSLECFYL